MTDAMSDMNTTPSEATYQLLMAPDQPLHPVMTREIDESRFVHTSVDKIQPAPVVDPATSTKSTNIVSEDGTDSPSLKVSNPLVENGAAIGKALNMNAPSENVTSLASESETTGPTATAVPSANENEQEEDEEGEEPDSHQRAIANTRNVEASDGLPIVADLIGMAQETLTSAYGSIDWAGEDGETFEKRGGFERVGDHIEGLLGGREPGYTCFTPLFKLTLGISAFVYMEIAPKLIDRTWLDYMLLLPPLESGSPIIVTKLLRPARSEELGAGLPRLGIGASDHLAVGCEIAWRVG